MCTNTPPTITWFRAIGSLYVINTLAWMMLWIASNDGFYAIHSPLTALQFLFAGIVIGIWMSVLAYPTNTVATNRLMIAIFIGALATLISNIAFAFWALDTLVTKCQDPPTYGCVYIQICANEQAYVITASVIIGILAIVDIIATVMCFLVLGVAYPSVTKQLRLASD